MFIQLTFNSYFSFTCWYWGYPRCRIISRNYESFYFKSFDHISSATPSVVLIFHVFNILKMLTNSYNPHYHKNSVLENQSWRLGGTVSACSYFLGLHHFWAHQGLLTACSGPLHPEDFLFAEVSVSPWTGNAGVARRSVLLGAAFSSFWVRVYTAQLVFATESPQTVALAGVRHEGRSAVPRKCV